MKNKNVSVNEDYNANSIVDDDEDDGDDDDDDDDDDVDDVNAAA